MLGTLQHPESAVVVLSVTFGIAALLLVCWIVVRRTGRQATLSRLLFILFALCTLATLYYAYSVVRLVNELE